MMRFILAFLLFALPATADTTAWLKGSTAVSLEGGDSNAWSSVTNVLDVSGEASCLDIGAGDRTDIIRVTGFTWPENVDTVDGIEIRYTVKANNSSDMAEWLVRLTLGGSQIGDDKQTGDFYTSSYVALTRGGASDTWGASLTASDLTSTLGVVIQAIDDGSGGGDDTWISLVEFRLHYTPTMGGEGEGEGESDAFFAFFNE